MRKLWLTVRWYLTGKSRRGGGHIDCRTAHGHVTAALREAQTSELAARLRADKARCDIYGLEVAVLSWARENSSLVDMLVVLDDVRARQGRNPLGLQRELILAGHLKPANGVLTATLEGGRRIAVANAKALLSVTALVLALFAGPARAETIAVSAAFHFTPQALDVISTRQCIAASNAFATCGEGNSAVVHRMEAKKAILASALTIGDQIIGKRSKAGKWVLRAFSVSLGAYAVMQNKRNEAAVRKAGR